MILYKRNTSLRIYLLWMVSLASATLGVYFLLDGSFICGLTLCVLFCLLYFYPIYGLIIREDSIFATRYEAFGFKKKGYIISSTSGYSGELFINGIRAGRSGTDIGIFAFVVVLFPFLYNNLILWVRDIQFNKIRMTIGLSGKEYDHILWLDRLDKALPLTGAVALALFSYNQIIP